MPKTQIKFSKEEQIAVAAALLRIAKLKTASDLSEWERKSSPMTRETLERYREIRAAEDAAQTRIAKLIGLMENMPV